MLGNRACFWPLCFKDLHRWNDENNKHMKITNATQHKCG